MERHKALALKLHAVRDGDGQIVVLRGSFEDPLIEQNVLLYETHAGRVVRLVEVWPGAIRRESAGGVSVRCRERLRCAMGNDTG